MRRKKKIGKNLIAVGEPKLVVEAKVPYLKLAK